MHASNPLRSATGSSPGSVSGRHSARSQPDPERRQRQAKASQVLNFTGLFGVQSAVEAGLARQQKRATPKRDPPL